MTITIRPELEQSLRARAQRLGISETEYVEQLLVEEDYWDESSLNETERAEIQAAIDEASAQVARGESVPASEVFQRLFQRHGLTR